MKTAAGLERMKSPDCSEQLMAYECTKLVSSKAGKHQGQASLTVLDLGYPRDRINIPVWEVLGKFIKPGVWGGHAASIFLQMHSYEHVLGEHFPFFSTLLKDRVRYGALQIISLYS